MTDEKPHTKANEEKPILITSALPYANGPLHLGHMVEYIQTDIYSRYLKLKGRTAVYVCADDTHGTPIEVNAKKQGKTPEAFIKEWYKSHKKDMDSYLINHDSFYTTHSDESKHFTEKIFKLLLEKDLIYTKEMELMYDPAEKRFLPDRYVKGICPKCGAADQYGDVCEKCGSTYNPTELLEPYSAISGETPVRKMSEHYFFKLSKFSDKLKTYIKDNKGLQPEIRNQILGWIKTGLEDWCISRDGPYFGFNIPGRKDKFFYVWLDAPIGYIASLSNYIGDKDFKKRTQKAEKFWNDSEVVHFIGKDIVYFHLLFWPAVLMGSGFKPADNVVVHGFLNVNGEKMSKSRGTFIMASDFFEKTKPEFLRYYFASSLTHSMTDLDLDVGNFKAKINNELVANVANFVYRTLSFTNKNFESKVSTVRDERLIESCIKKAELTGKAFEEFNYREAVRLIMDISASGNKYFQDNAPWELIKENKEETQKVLTDCVNMIKILAILFKPVLPEFSEKVAKQLGLKDLNWNSLSDRLENKKIGKAEIIFRKIEDLNIGVSEKMVQESKVDGFGKLNLKVAKILDVREHNKADKLLLVNIDLGDEKRQLVAGLKPYYPDTSVLVGKHIICVTNLEHANLRGEMSQGMMLAAETKDGKTVEVLEAPGAKPGTQVVVDGIKPHVAVIKFDEFLKAKMYVDNHGVMHEGKALTANGKEIKTKVVKDGSVR